MNPTSATFPSGDSSAANVTAPTAGKNNSRVVMTRLCCCRSFTAAEDCMATMVPSIAIVNGWCAKRVNASTPPWR